MVTGLTDFVSDSEHFVGQPVSDLGGLGPATVAADDVMRLGSHPTHIDHEQQSHDHLHSSHVFPTKQTSSPLSLPHWYEEIESGNEKQGEQQASINGLSWQFPSTRMVGMTHHNSSFFASICPYFPLPTKIK